MNRSPAEKDLEVTGHGRLNISWQRGLSVNKADCVLCHTEIMASRLREVFTFSIWYYWWICVQIWVPELKGTWRNWRGSSREQQRWSGTQGICKELDFVGLAKRWSNISLQLYRWQLKADGPHSSLQQLVIKQAVMDLSCSLGRSGWTLGKDMFTRRVVQHWNRLFIERLESLILEVFKTSLPKTIADLTWHSHSPVSSRRLE